MKGLDLHREFFRECGMPLLATNFSNELSQIAVASVGFGSDRLGADDEISQDHCWEPGFQVFSDRLPMATLKRIEAYLFANLPWEFRGFRRSDCCGSPNTIRAWTVDGFFSSMTSFARPPSQDSQWLLIADEALHHVTNGEVFHDTAGDFTKRREAFAYYPENVWRFKLAGRALRMSVRRYEAERCAAHGEDVTANVMLSDGLRELFHFVCLANRRYAPYDRWLHWAFRRLPALAGDLDPAIAEMTGTSDMRRRLALYGECERTCADWAYQHGLAPKGQCWWAGLRGTIQGELRSCTTPSWIGVEHGYASQFALGGTFRQPFPGWQHDGDAESP